MACGHTKCHTSKKVSCEMGSEINIFLALVSTGTYVYGVDSREEITIEPNVVENDKEYMVCATTKTRIKSAVVQSPSKKEEELIITGINSNNRYEYYYLTEGNIR